MPQHTALIWQNPIDAATLHRAHVEHPHAFDVFINDPTRPPEALSPSSCDPSSLAAASHGVHFITGERDSWLLPREQAAYLHEYGFDTLIWMDGKAIPQQTLTIKPWFRPPEAHAIGTILVVGAGIAGAATAHALARRGLDVTVIEAETDCASQASGNHQGLLYAKISPHDTIQTRLLLSAYGFSRRLLAQYADADFWHNCGVLHLNHNPQEQQRNAQLAQQTHNRHLFYPVNAEQARERAGIDLNGQDGLFWPQGAWIQPKAWIQTLLAHPNIRLHTQTRLDRLQRHNDHWLAHSQTPSGGLTLAASHIIFCGGTSALPAPLPPLPLHHIRGQTTLAAATEPSRQLRCAISGQSYISPAHQGLHCFGASFVPHDDDTAWRASEDTANHRALGQLSHALQHALPTTQRGHTALRADCHDHLPAVGALGDFAQMRRVYAKLAHDKNLPITSPCPYHTGLFINTAHGSRGLATAPLCGELIASQILGTPSPLEPTVARALMPNRLLIRELIHANHAHHAVK